MRNSAEERLVLVVAVPSGIEASEAFEKNTAGISLMALLDIHKVLTRFAFDWEVATVDGEKALVNIDVDTDDAKEFYASVLGKINSTRNLDEVKTGEYRGLIICSMKGLMGAHKSQPLITKMGPAIRQVVMDSKCVLLSGYGILATFECKDINHNWIFYMYNVTSLSLMQQSIDDKFSSFPLLLEDKIRDLGGHFCWSDKSCELLILDKKLVTVQDDRSIKIGCNTFCYVIDENP